MNPLPSARLFAWLRSHEPQYAKAAARSIFDAYWRDGRAMDEPNALREALQQAGVPVATIAAAQSDADAARLLRAEVDAAIAAGAFGSPFIFVDGEPFFGVDSFELIDDWLTKGGW
jgi:2-hydroxychromene-2-carboxylate isomerase